MKKLTIILALAAATAFAADSAPWRPTPGMTGTFHSIAGDNHLEIFPDARIKLDKSKGFTFSGTFLPDPSGTPDRYLASICRTLATDAQSGEGKSCFFVLSFEPSDAVWQLLGSGETPDEIQWLEDMPKYVSKHGDTVIRKKGWFETRFVSDLPLHAYSSEVTPEAARKRLVGVWQNFAGGFGVVSVILAPNGYGIFGASVMSMPCSWSVRKTDDGWLLACKIYEGGTSPAQFTTSFAILKADSRLTRLQLLATDRTLEAATAAADALDPDAPPSYLYRACDTVPPELAERLADAISANPAP